MRTLAATLVTAAMVTLCAEAAVAQVSVYGVYGIGYPGRPVGVAARAMGDGIAAFDPRSAVNPATVALERRLRVSGMLVTSGRKYEIDNTVTGDLRDTRFAFALLAGPLGSSPLSFGVSYSLYADRTYDLVTSDSVVVRGETIAVDDELASDGGIADVRAALGWFVSPAVQIGAGLHLLSGSTRERVARSFDDPLYLPITQEGDVAYTGWGVSAGAVYTPFQRLRFGVSVRWDSRLDADEPLLPTTEIQLPMMVTAGMSALPLPALQWSASASWRSWSRARDDLPSDANFSVFDTWEVGTGLQFGGPGLGAGRFPLRVGVRYAQLPFSGMDDQPREIDFTAGSAISFAAARATLEFAVERVMRDGGGASERAWQISAGLSLRP